MTLEIGFTDELTNTQYAPLAVICAHYQQHHTLDPLHQVHIPMRERDFGPADKLIQVLLSILAGCETLSEVNPRLKSERGLAAIWKWSSWADQSTLSRTLDALTLMNLDQLRHSSWLIWHPGSQVKAHDWRAFLWLDFDLSGLPCGPQAQASQKGYFSGKKMSPGANWLGSVRSNTGKPCGRTSIPAIGIPSTASSQPSWRPKLL